MTAVAKAIVKVVTKTVEAVGSVVKKVAEVVVDTVKYVAENPEVLAIALAAPYAVAAVGKAIGASAAAISLSTQPITAAAISASQGGDLEDIGKAALGSFIGQGVGTTVAKQVGTSIGAAGNTAQTALANAIGGATGSAAGAVATGQDVGEAALMGAAGSAGASLARSGAVELGQQPQSFIGDVVADIGEAAGRTVAGGDIRQELTGAVFNSLTREGQIALDELRSRPETDATKQVIAAFSEPRSPGVGTQLGEATAGLTGAFIPEQTTRTDLPEVNLPRIDLEPTVVNRLPEVTVTARPDAFDATDVRTGKVIPSSLPSGEARTAGTAGGVTTTTPAGAEREAPATPTAREETAAAAPEPMPAPEDMTGAELIESAAGDEEAQRLPEVEVVGEEEPDVRMPRADQLSEEPIDVTKLTDEELIEILNQEFPVTEPEAPKAPEPDFNPLDVRRAGGTTRRAAPRSISPRVVGTSPTAAIVGQKEPIFGGEEDAQQSVWNTRSLRLRKALGG